MRRALIIDDDVCILDLATLALESRGWEVLAASSAEDAIRLALAGKPEIILIDVHMPVMDGPELLKDLRSHVDIHDVPIVWLTAESSVRPSGLEDRGSVVGCIAKPFDPRKLSDSIDVLLRSYRRVTSL